MAIHSKEEIFSSLDDEVFGTGFLPNPLPKYKLPRHETDPTAAYQLVHDELLLDGNSRQNVATFCQTWVDPEVRKLMDECLDKNMIDKDEYPQMAELEARCVHMLADLWNAPDAANAMGCSTTGSSEAAMLGGLALKWRWRKRREQGGKPTDRPNLICGPVQICWPKFAKYFDVELRQIPCEGRRLMMLPEEVLKRCDENTIGVVATLGITYTLQYEPVKAVATALDDLEEEHGLDIPVHVDAASGGFIAPFIHPGVVWDFRIQRVKSINTSGHKFGLAPLGCGWAVWREAEDLPEDLIFRVKYLGGNMPTFALNFSRPGGKSQRSMAKNIPSETRTRRIAYCSKSLLPSSTNWTSRFQSTSCPSVGGCAATIPHIMQFDFSGNRVTQDLAGLRLISVLDNYVQTANGGVVSEFSRLEIMCPSVRPIERAMREPRMDPQSTVFPAQPCRP